MINEDKLVQGFVDEALRCLSEASVLPTGEPAYNDSIEMASNIYEMLKKTELEDRKLDDEILQAARKHDIDLQKMELEKKKRDDSVVTEDRKLDFEKTKFERNATIEESKLDHTKDVDEEHSMLERTKMNMQEAIEGRRLEFEREKLNATTIDNTNKLDFEERMHTDNVQIERLKIKSTEKIAEEERNINRKKMYTDSLIFVGKAGLIFLLGTAMFKSEEDCRLYSKNIVQTIGKIIG